MCKKIICLTSFVLLLGLSGVVQAEGVLLDVIEDDFNTPHLYYDANVGTPNVAGTIWDDFTGWRAGETVDVLVADMDVNHPDQLYIESTGSMWGGSGSVFNPLGPFLYKVAPHDFVATVELTDYPGDPNEPATWIYNNDGGLMARAPIDPCDVAGTGEDWVSIDYFPLWNLGNFLWDCNDDTVFEAGSNGLVWDAHRYLQLERRGNIIIVRTSADGNDWVEMGPSPRTRDDFDGLPLQVGLRHATYVAGTTGYVAFDDFRLELYENVKARFPSPEDGATATPDELEWLAGDYAAMHDVYIGTDLEDVCDANVPTATVADNNYTVSGLTPGITYYWRIDEVNGPNTWKGDVWSFTTIPFEAWNPRPADGAECSTPHGVISWNAGAEVDYHRIYFGTDEAVVTNATPFNTTGLLLYVASYDGTSYDLGMLEFETTYYWRIDEVNFPTTWKGDTWSFTTAHYIPIQDANRVGYWKLDGTECTNAAFDSSGYHYHGVLVNGPSYLGDGNGPQETGGALEFDGKNDYVELPIGPLISSLTNSTFMMWMNSAFGGQWVRALDFGAEDPNFYMCLGPRWWFMDDMYFSITTDGTLNGPGAEIVITTGFDLPPDEWHHVAVTIDADADIAILYYDAGEVGRNTSFTLSPNDLGETVNNWLGRSHDEGDSYYWGSMAHVKIFDYALSAEEVAKEMRVNPALAWGPSPATGVQTDVIRARPLKWSPGDYVQDVNEHEVYFGTDEDAVTDANLSTVGSDPNVDLYVVSDPCWDPGVLAYGETYYWRVDEVNLAHFDKRWKGPVWSFSTADYLIIDNFNWYVTRDELGTTWKDGYSVYPAVENGSNITLSSAMDNRYYTQAPWFRPTAPESPIYGGSNALQFVYDNDGSVTVKIPGNDPFTYGVLNYYSEMEANIADLEAVSNWELEGVKSLSVWFYGDPCNAAGTYEQMYLALEDNDGDLTLVKYGDPNIIDEDMTDVQLNEWQEWNIDLEWFTDVNVNADANANFDLTKVKKIYIGFGERGNNTNIGGYGIVYFDSISLYRPRCIAGIVTGDSTGDCTVNVEDFADLVDSWGADVNTLPSPTPIIELDANDVSTGLVTTWVNKQATPIGGQFDYDPCDVNNNPMKETVFGRGAVTFDGNDYLIADFNAPGGITGANDFTMIMNVFNPTISAEEMVFTWAKRGGPASTTGGIGYGSDAPWGAVVHWNAGGLEPDMGYDGGVPSAGRWHEIAIAYEGGVSTYERVWVDGVLNAVEGDKILDIYDNNAVFLGCGYEPNDTDPNILERTLHFSGSLARLRVYDEALPGYLIEYMVTGKLSADLNNDGEVDFKDLATIINNWLATKEWP